MEKGISLLDLLSENKIMHSKSEARRVIANNGLKINDTLISDDKKIIRLEDFKNKVLKISFGKKDTIKLKLFKIFIFIYNFLNKSRSDCSNRINSCFNISRRAFHFKTNPK